MSTDVTRSQTTLGDLAPDFRLPAAQGDEVMLSGYRGNKHVLLVFLAGMT